MTDRQRELIAELLLTPMDGATAGAVLALVDDHRRMRGLLQHAVAAGRIDGEWLEAARAALGTASTGEVSS